MIRSSLCDYSEGCILVKGTITVQTTGVAAAPKNRNKKLIFKNCTPFIDCISGINNKEIDFVKDIDVVMPMYNLIEYSENYLKTSESLWQYYRDEPFINNNGLFIDVPDHPDSASFNSKQKITSQTGNNDTKYVKVMVLLKYLTNFWRTLEMSLINCEVNIF